MNDPNKFDEFYQKKMDYKMPNGESFNDIAALLFTLEEREREFGKVEFDENDDIWVIDLEDKNIKLKIENMNDFYVFLAKRKLIGDKKND